ncbi:CsbD family protein [Myxosarcina sp. GI1]|uniref:CsbD family protein n=1 Tax=Myxosarcina sp. GI1 TaxID=1541065 RepID=UPI0012E02934|nr:CsbD family protein [Myxosarcina sp. GI1]
MATEKNQNPAENLVEKAEARSEKIEGKVQEAIGKMDNDSQDVKEGQAKQAEAKKKG